MFFSFVDPTEKPDGIDCRFFRNNYYQLAEEPAAIFVDPKAHTILFENCYSSKGFFPVVQKSFKCHLLDILAVFPFKNTLTVVCRTGKAEIPEYATNFYALRQFLQTEVSSPETGSSRDNPLIGFAYAGGIFLGILGCLSLAGIIPNHFLPFLALLGGILGWFCCHMVVHFGDRFLKMDFSKPIGYGTIGGFSSIFVINIIGYLSQRFIWDISPLFYNTIILTFFSVGVIIGFYKRTVR